MSFNKVLGLLFKWRRTGGRKEIGVKSRVETEGNIGTDSYYDTGTQVTTLRIRSSRGSSWLYGEKSGYGD